MLFKIKETGEIKEVTYRPELEDLLPNYTESDKSIERCDEADGEISQDGFDWWAEWADQMTAATKKYYDITREEKIHYPLPDRFIANEIEDEPAMLDNLCDAIEEGRIEWAPISSDPWSDYGWIQK
jgi:hypothetical protein